MGQIWNHNENFEVLKLKVRQTPKGHDAANTCVRQLLGPNSTWPPNLAAWGDKHSRPWLLWVSHGGSCAGQLWLTVSPGHLRCRLQPWPPEAGPSSSSLTSTAQSPVCEEWAPHTQGRGTKLYLLNGDSKELCAHNFKSTTVLLGWKFTALGAFARDKWNRKIKLSQSTN